jgi:hypothetical protein
MTIDRQLVFLPEVVVCATRDGCDGDWDWDWDSYRMMI